MSQDTADKLEAILFLHWKASQESSVWEQMQEETAPILPEDMERRADFMSVVLPAMWAAYRLGLESLPEDPILPEALRLLRDLADLQNGAPLVRFEEEWEQTMEEVWAFLEKYETE